MKIRMASAVDADTSAREVHRLCAKIADQVDNGQWWNAMANATELVAVCQDGCRAVIDRVAKRASAPKNDSPGKKTKKSKKSKKTKKKAGG